jgi:hypothetical protein
MKSDYWDVRRFHETSVRVRYVVSVSEQQVSRPAVRTGKDEMEEKRYRSRYVFWKRGV